MQDPVLTLQGVTRNFGPVAAVRDLDLAIHAGEFFALLGPSGSGKTTLLRMIAGLETPDAGRIFISGRDVTALPPYARGIGMVFQDFLLFPHRTVRENIAFPLRMQGMSPAHQREQVRWVLDFVRLSGFDERYPHQLSGGQKQRVALARGLVARPAILLLDEPLANLDRELRKEMEIEVRRFQVELGIPFVYVTHNQEEALTMSDRIAVMSAGRIEQVGRKLDVYARPASRFVAAFVGSSNRLGGRLLAVDGDHAKLSWEGGTIEVRTPALATSGDHVELFVKSERIGIAPAGSIPASDPRRNRRRGRLRDIIFKGQYSDYLVRLDGGTEIIASDAPELAGVQVHGEVEILWAPDAADCFLVEA